MRPISTLLAAISPVRGGIVTAAFSVCFCATLAQAQPMGALVQTLYAACDAARTADQGTASAPFEPFGFEPLTSVSDAYSAWLLREARVMFDLPELTQDQIDLVLPARLATFDKPAGPHSPTLFAIPDQADGTLAVHNGARGEDFTCFARLFTWNDVKDIADAMTVLNGQPFRRGPAKVGTIGAASGLILLTAGATTKDESDTLKIESWRPPVYQNDDRPITSIVLELKS